MYRPFLTPSPSSALRASTSPSTSIGVSTPDSSLPTWFTLHGLYDFRLLVWILTREALPNHQKEFMVLQHHYLGIQVYDLKPITRSFALHCGLDKLQKGYVLRAIDMVFQLVDKFSAACSRPWSFISTRTWLSKHVAEAVHWF
ncbi:hypothetical protein SASPL_151035 [Salvia splendens]|uniref:Uncharacterized protein n=1 Tax=Salvia splendens TaxID=180675 RepID=A0A8X8Z378_SALSN|nr:hypothetical protein SASPL_151035 [Salvia splendens]